MAQIKQYNSKIKMVGLPDTTNVQDKQLRLYLDRLNQTLTEFNTSINSLNQFADIKNIVSALVNNKDFVSFIDNKTKDISKKEAEKVVDDDKRKNRPKVLTAISVDPKTHVMKPDAGTKDFDVKYEPDDILNYQKGVIWSSSDINVATVDEDGRVTPVNVGECFITATSEYNVNIYDFATLKISNEYQLFVTANTKWQTSGDGSISVVYTEEFNPSEDDPVWSSSDNTVTVADGLSEDEAKKQAAFGLASNVENREYIVADSKVVYWRNTEKDYYKTEAFTTVSVGAVCIPGDTGFTTPVYFCEYDSNTATVCRLFSKAFDGSDSEATDEQKIEYSSVNCLVAENIAAKTPPRNVHMIMTSYKTRNSEEDEWTENFTGLPRYTVETGESVTLNYHNGTEDLTATFIQVTTCDGKFPCWIDKGIWDGTTEHSTTYIGCSTYQPTVETYEDGTQYIKSGVDDDGDARIRHSNPNVSGYFEYNGLWYYTRGTIYDPIIFDLDTYNAWSIAPCNEKSETVYTMKDKSSAGEQYGTISAEGEFTQAGIIFRASKGVFSINTNGVQYFTTFTYDG